MIRTVRNCPRCRLPDISGKWVIISTTIQCTGPTHSVISRSLRPSKGRVDYQGDDKAEMEAVAKKLQIRGGACCVESADKVEKCRCEEIADS
jgi:hypothetical protein